MKKFLLLSALFLSACAATPPMPGNVSRAGLPGEGVSDRCRPFAVALCEKLRPNVDELMRITYGWMDRGEYGGHVIVVYRKEGQYWGVDNMVGPIQLTGTNQKAWIRQIHRNGYSRPDPFFMAIAAVEKVVPEEKIERPGLRSKSRIAAVTR